MKKTVLIALALTLSISSFAQIGGYFTPVYSEDYGFGPREDTNVAVENMRALLNSYPRANHVPVVVIEGNANVVLNGASTFTAQISSVDPIQSVVWTLPDATPATSNENSVTATWTTTGVRTISVTVTNTTGSTTATMDVNVFEWNWDNEISYCGNDEFVSSVGMGGNGEIVWGIMIPARYMGGRNFLTDAKAYIKNAGNYELFIYQGGETAPQTLLYQHTYNVTASEAWYTFDIYDIIDLDTASSLWIILHTNGVNYPAAYSTFCGDLNSSLIRYQGNWTNIQTLAASLNPTWMIKATTSAVEPAMNIAINGSSRGISDSPLTFTVSGPSDATYEWTLTGATPSTATGQTVSATYAAGGTYTITVNATRGINTASATHTITIAECNTASLPFTMGFEATQPLDCWFFEDVDGDSHGWISSAEQGFADTYHGGSASMMSASYINQVGALTPNNWMISQKIHIPAGGATITWWDWAQDNNDYAEHYSVLISTTNTVSSFTTTLLDVTTSAGHTWTQRTATIQNFDDQDVYIAFRHHSCTNQYWLAIDDINITAGQPSPVNGVLMLGSDPKYPVAAATKGGAKSMPQWTPIRRHFNVRDINGNTVNSDEILSSGKCILIDYSATWCSWCWVMHQNGTLDAIHHQLGDQIVVIWADVDPSTTDAQVRGQGSTQGDWTDGGACPYPIINDDATESLVGSSYITSYPTVVFVAPNPQGTASIKEVAQNEVSIYPNPTNGKLYINAEGIQEVNVIDVNGRTVMSNRNAKMVDMTNLSDGVYFVHVITANGVSVQKVVRK